MDRGFIRWHLVWMGPAIALLLVVFFSRLLLSDKLLVPDGLIPDFLPMEWWSDHIFSGFPLIADPIWQTFYPVRYLIYKCFGLNFNYYILFSYGLMAYFTYGYVHCLTENKLSALTAGLLFCFCGYSIFEIGHAGIFIHTICWLPLILWAVEKLKDNYSAVWIFLAVFGVAMTVAGGFPQLTLAIALLLASYCVLCGAGTYKKTMFYYGILLGGWLISAPIFIPTFMHLHLTTRHHLPWEMFASYYVEFKQLLLFVFPYLMGGYYMYPGISVFGDWEIVGNHGYVGFLTLVLAAVCLYRSRASFKVLKWFWAIWAAVSVLVALGPGSGFFYKLMFHVPLLKNFRAPERYLFIFAFAMSVLAGLGVDSIMRGVLKTSREKRTVVIAALIFTVILLMLAWSVYPSIQNLCRERLQIELPVIWLYPAFFVQTIGIAISLAALIYWLRDSSSKYRAWIAVFTLLAEVMFNAYFSYWHPEFGIWTKQALKNPPQYVSQFRDILDSTHQRYIKMQPLVQGFGKYFSLNLPMYYKLSSAAGYTSLSVSEYLDFLQMTERGGLLTDPAALEKNQAINMAGIKYLLSDEKDPLNAIWFKNSARFVLKNKVDNLLVYENLEAMPRAWFAAHIKVMKRSDMLPVIHSGKFSDGTYFNPATTALLETGVTALPEFDKDASAVLKIQQLSPQKISLETHSKTAQFLVLSDVLYPGWYAYIDGKKTPLYRANYIYRGIVVPDGDHIIQFRFKPYYLYFGMMISVMTLLIILFMMLRARRLR